MNDLLTCAQQNFALRLGDVTAIGWAITLNYFYCVLLIFYMLQKLLPRLAPAERSLYRQFWILVGALYLLLGINKQLDFQTILTDTGRCVSQLEGWYDVRRNFQTTAILSGILLCTASLFAIKWRFSQISNRLRLAFLGLGFTALFVVIRAASFHHLDQFSLLKTLNIRFHSVLEILGILFVSLNAIFLTFKRFQRRRPSITGYDDVSIKHQTPRSYAE